MAFPVANLKCHGNVFNLGNSVRMVSFVQAQSKNIVEK